MTSHFFSRRKVSQLVPTACCIHAKSPDGAASGRSDTDGRAPSCQSPTQRAPGAQCYLRSLAARAASPPAAAEPSAPPGAGAAPASAAISMSSASSNSSSGLGPGPAAGATAYTGVLWKELTTSSTASWQGRPSASSTGVRSCLRPAARSGRRRPVARAWQERAQAPEFTPGSTGR